MRNQLLRDADGPGWRLHRNSRASSIRSSGRSAAGAQLAAVNARNRSRIAVAGGQPQPQQTGFVTPIGRWLRQMPRRCGGLAFRRVWSAGWISPSSPGASPETLEFAPAVA
jgi:hypothetical protein